MEKFMNNVNKKAREDNQTLFASLSQFSKTGKEKCLIIHFRMRKKMTNVKFKKHQHTRNRLLLRILQAQTPRAKNRYKESNMVCAKAFLRTL